MNVPGIGYEALTTEADARARRIAESTLMTMVQVVALSAIAVLRDSRE